MSKVADLKNALTELFRKGTEVGYTETEIDEFLEGIDYHTLLQAVWDSAETVYVAYRKAGYSKKFLSEHESDIILHKAAKKAFDDFGLKKLPTVKSLNEEFARLLTEKKAAYADYHKTQEQMRELLIHKANAAYLLGLEERKQQITERQREEK